jgi:hypothetical protein
MYILYIHTYIGGWGRDSAAVPTGKSCRFVRACGRAGGPRARSIPITKVDLQDDVVHLLPARWPFVASLLPFFCSAFHTNAGVSLRLPGHSYDSCIDFYYLSWLHQATPCAESYCFVIPFGSALLGFLSSSSSSSSSSSASSFCCLRLAFRNLARARPLGSSQRVCAAMGPQPCPGPCADGTVKELVSETLRGKWAHSEGVKWEWRTSDVQHTKCAWWRLGVPCHRLAWPLDRRRCLGPLADEGSACCAGALTDHSGSRNGSILQEWEVLPKKAPVSQQ